MADGSPVDDEQLVVFMQLAATLNKEVDLLLPITLGCNIDGMHKGQTALHRACYHGHPLMVQLLVGAGARRDILNAAGQTARQVAVERGHTACVQVVDRA